MILLPIQESEAFDRLAILRAKQLHELPVNSEHDALVNRLAEELGDSSLGAVLHSDEYDALFLANLEVFKFVDKATRDECLASEVDAANQRRYAAKKALQERFWPASPLSEVKSKRPNDLEPERLSPERAVKQFESVMEEVRKAIQPIMDKGKDLQPEPQKPTVHPKSQGGAA